MDVIDLLHALVEIPSPSGDEDAVCVFARDWLRDQGLPASLEPAQGGGHNVVCDRGRPRLFLASHLDTVPAGPPVRRTTRTLYGRGSCDAKGSVAAMMVAAVQAYDAGLDGFGLRFTVGEETDMRGALAIGRLPFAVVGEPTGLQAVPATNGTWSLRITARGRRAHTSVPEEGVNAIEAVQEAVATLRDHLPEGAWLATTMIEGGIADNVVPAHAAAVVNIRFPPGARPVDAKGLLPDFRLETLTRVDSVGSPLPAWWPSHIPVADKAPYVTELSIYQRGVVLGPGSIRDAHTDHEKVELRQVRQAVRLYQDILRVAPTKAPSPG